jgi:two-component system response regulator RegX3
MVGEKYALHVDDDAMMCDLVGRVLERLGYKVASVRNGGEALRALIETPPSVILLDINLGEESGFDLCALLREAGTSAPLAFLTGHRTLAHVRRAQEVGGDYFIIKPFTPATLRTGIERAFAARLKLLDEN